MNKTNSRLVTVTEIYRTWFPSTAPGNSGGWADVWTRLGRRRVRSPGKARKLARRLRRDFDATKPGKERRYSVVGSADVYVGVRA